MNRTTKTRTSPQRLSWLDLYLCRVFAAELTGAWLVDVGFGQDPVTTVEWAESTRSFGTRVIGVEQDPRLVAHAQQTKALVGSAGADHIAFCTGDFQLEGLVPRDSVAVVRVANVLRAYAPAEVHRARAQLAGALRHAGILLDATTDRRGDVGAALVLRRDGPALVRERMVFSTTGARGASPRMFRDVLPRDLRRCAGPHTPIGQFLEGWHGAFLSAHASGDGSCSDTTTPKASHRQAALGLERLRRSLTVDDDLRWVAPGIVEWRPRGGVPRGA